MPLRFTVFFLLFSNRITLQFVAALAAAATVVHRFIESFFSLFEPSRRDQHSRRRRHVSVVDISPAIFSGQIGWEVVYTLGSGCGSVGSDVASIARVL